MRNEMGRRELPLQKLTHIDLIIEQRFDVIIEHDVSAWFWFGLGGMGVPAVTPVWLRAAACKSITIIKVAVIEPGFAL